MRLYMKAIPDKPNTETGRRDCRRELEVVYNAWAVRALYGHSLQFALHSGSEQLRRITSQWTWIGLVRRRVHE